LADETRGLLGRFGTRTQSGVVKPADRRLGRGELDSHLRDLGPDGDTARLLDADTDSAMRSVASLSSLTAPLALQYMERLGRPIPNLTPELGAQIVGRAYVAHMVVEADPARYGAADVPVLGTLPPLKRGRVPQDLLSRVVKASRRSFEALCALTPEAWEGFVWCLTKRAHDQARDELLPVEVVDGLARFAWILRQVDLHYGLEPERVS
jgi:hypothetical protein